MSVLFKLAMAAVIPFTVTAVAQQESGPIVWVADTESDCKTIESGVASTYGAENGNQTASGETFNPGALTAAHPSLPFGSRVRVKNQKNGRTVVVKINDRGPFVQGRIIDLSTAAASAIGFSGLARVSIQKCN